MESVVQGQVLGVTGRTTRNGKTLYDVAFSDGNKYTVFEPGLATQAQQLMGQQVSARVSVKQNGQYTNYNLEEIAPAGQLGPVAMPAPAGAPLPAIPMQAQPDPAEKDRRISKLSVLSSSATVVAALFEGAGPEAAQEAVDVWIGAAKQAFDLVYGSPQANGVPQTPAGLAEFVNSNVVNEGGVQVGVAETPPAEAPSVQW